MDRRLFLLFIAGLFLSLSILSGCDTVKGFLPKRCPASCDDGLVCTQDRCNADTEYQCVHEEMSPCDGNSVCEQGEYLTSTDCPNCNDANKCTTDHYSYETGKCSNDPVPNCCGNALCESGETSSSCAADCPTCDDDNSCTRDVFDRAKGVCVNSIIAPCCGNLRCEFDESFATCSQDCNPGKQDEIGLCGSNETCVTAVALKYKDSEVCKNAYTISGTDNCYKEMAVQLNRSFMCSRISSDKMIHECQEDYAVSIIDTSRCPTTNPNNCYERIALRSGQVGICSFMVEEFVATRDDFILKCKAAVSENPLVCKQISKTWIADKCYTELAVRFKDFALCDAVQLDKVSCEYQVDEAIAGLEEI